MNEMMVLYICKTCGFPRDMTPMYPFYNSADSVPLYNTSVTHCPNGHGLMYQVKQGDRLAVIEEEKEKEATELLKEWKEFSLNAVPTGHVHFDFLGRKKMIEKTDRFLGKNEGKNE